MTSNKERRVGSPTLPVAHKTPEIFQCGQTFRTTTIGPRFLDLSICSLVSPFLLEGEELTGVLNVHRNITSSICTPGLERQNRTQRNSLKSAPEASIPQISTPTRVLIRTEPVACQRFVRGIFLGFSDTSSLYTFFVSLSI